NLYFIITKKMEKICEIVPSQKGIDKINVRDYLMVKERSWEDKFYWCCEKRKSNECKDHATTILINNLYHLQKFNDHNHAPQASSAKVA
ncbi:458_t:CDS:1, partial [Dentiscutata heterogama]